MPFGIFRLHLISNLATTLVSPCFHLARLAFRLFLLWSSLAYILMGRLHGDLCVMKKSIINLTNSFASCSSFCNSVTGGFKKTRGYRLFFALSYVSWIRCEYSKNTDSQIVLCAKITKAIVVDIQKTNSNLDISQKPKLQKPFDRMCWNDATPTVLLLYVIPWGVVDIQFVEYKLSLQCLDPKNGVERCRSRDRPSFQSTDSFNIWYTSHQSPFFIN